MILFNQTSTTTAMGEHDMSTPDWDTYLASEEEVLRLTQRVEDLEAIVTEYRSQMNSVLGSASWKLTSPFRAAATKVRVGKVRLKRKLKNLKRRLNHEQPNNASTKPLTAGLFPPNLSTLPEGSPLRRPYRPTQRPKLPASPLFLNSPKNPTTKTKSVAVVAHVHYPELWNDIDDRLVRMPQDYDLFITITQGKGELIIPTIKQRHPHAHIEITQNRGRDWGPFMTLLNQGHLHGYAAIAKVHTKKSEHRVDGDGWRLALLDGVFESPEHINRTIKLLESDPEAGMVVPNGQIAATEHWGSNQGIVESLSARLPMAFDPDELQFSSGSMFWAKGWIIERLSDLDLTIDDFEIEAGHYDGTTAHALERMMGIFTVTAGMRITQNFDVRKELLNYSKNPTPVPQTFAFYLPQYHQTKENDEFWGEGFTDWKNVEKALPLFPNHQQPKLPSLEVGQYDLRNTKVLKEQSERTKTLGLDGLIFHHYWFDGKKVLDAPINNWLGDPTIDLPLAICWANESWTRNWDGLNTDILIQQNYTEDWATRFFNDITPFLHDQRYIRINDKPLLIIYRIDQIPNPAETISTWREQAQQANLNGLHILAVTPSRDFGQLSKAAEAHLDGLINFPPGSAIDLQSLITERPLDPTMAADILSYHHAANTTTQSHGSIPTHPGIMPGWDNTARRGKDAYVFHGSNQITFQRWINNAVKTKKGENNTDNLLFINAWNEWAEGAALEDRF
jgi:lipopolysaccharide biosynthesis protein